MPANQTLYLFIFMLLLSPYLNAQVTSSEQADSLRLSIRSGEIEPVEHAINIGMQIYDFYKESGDSCGMVKMGPILATSWELVGKIDSAIQMLLEIRPMSKQCGEAAYITTIIAEVSLYIEVNEFEKTLTLINKAELELTEDSADSLRYMLWPNKAIAYFYLDQTSEATRVFRQIYYYAREHKSPEHQIDALSNLGALHGSLEHLDSAEYYLKMASVLCAKTECDDQLELLQNLATLATYGEDYQLSSVYLDSAIRISQRKGDLASETDLWRELSVSVYWAGLCDSAWNSMYEHANLLDSLKNKERLRAYAEFQEKYESEKKARQIQQLQIERLDADLRESQLRRTRNVYLFGGLGVLLLTIALFSRLRYISKTKAIIEKERNRSNELLLNILPYDVAEELKAKGSSEARDYEDVTVVFTDFQQFTETAQRLSAKELVGEVNSCFQAFDNICMKYNIEKIKTIGDAYMAAGGLHKPRTANAADVVSAALEMQHFIEERYKIKDAKGEPAFEMRVGIHTGPVVAGIVGVKKFQYDLWGDTVNTASRVENAGEVGRVNISQATYELLKADPQFSFESRGKIDVKGKGEMNMYFVKLVENPADHQ